MVELSRRKHMASGSRLARACVCEDYVRESLELRIPLAPGASAVAGHKAACGRRGTPSSGWAGRRALSELRAFAEARNWPRSEKLGTHSFRRGAARAVLGARGSFSQLLRSGQWRSSAYQPYLDIGHEEATAIASVLVEGSYDE